MLLNDEFFFDCMADEGPMPVFDADDLRQEPEFTVAAMQRDDDRLRMLFTGALPSEAA